MRVWILQDWSGENLARVFTSREAAIHKAKGWLKEDDPIFFTKVVEPMPLDAPNGVWSVERWEHSEHFHHGDADLGFWVFQAEVES